MRKTTILALFSAALAALPLQAQNQLPLKDGDKLVFWGDSITDFGYYVPFVQMALAIKEPGKTIDVHNAGVGGDTVERAMVRLDYDVLAFKPAYVFVCLGTNDLGGEQYVSTEFSKAKQARIDVALRNLAAALDKIKDSGAKPVLLGLTAYDQYSLDLKSARYPNYNATGKAKLNEGIAKLAAGKGVPFVDIFTPMTKAESEHPELHLSGPDRVHPNRAGHLLVAFELFKALGLQSKNPSVSISDGKADVSNASVKELSSSKDSVKFRYAPDTLPLPVDGDYERIAEISPLPAELNTERLSVKGLAPGEYSLKFDGREIAKFSAERLASGVDLAALDTPNQRKAKSLLGLMEKFKSSTVPLRKIAASLMIAKMEKADLNDEASIDKALDKWLDSCKSSPAYVGRKQAVEMYKANRAKRAELENVPLELAKQMRAAAKPVECAVEISKDAK
jgi:lysophospholipase L1-like esterase